MEEKKLDLNSIIGFALIFVILIWMLYNGQQKEAEKRLQTTEEVVKDTLAPAPKVTQIVETLQDTLVSDSIKNLQQKAALGSFAYASTLPSAEGGETVMENDVLKLVIDNKGGYITKAEVKNFERFYKGSNQIVNIIKENNASLNLALKTVDNRI